MFRRGYLLIYVFISVSVLSCVKHDNRVSLTSRISVSVPAKPRDILIDSSQYSVNWTTSFEDDNMALYRFKVLVPGNEIPEGSLAELKNNTDDFLSSFETGSIDSVYTVEANHLEVRLSFDYISDNEKYKFYGRFLLIDTSFVAICYVTPFPVDRFSKSKKDKIFESVIVK